MSGDAGSALERVGRQAEYALFGIDRKALLGAFEIGALRLYARDLRSMTVEELESAVAGSVTWWDAEESLPSTAGYARAAGLSAWLP